MQVHEIPRDYGGEGRILYIFSTKALIYTAVGAGIGLIFYFIFRMLKLSKVGLIITAILAFIGFAIGTFKVPEAAGLSITRKVGGEKIDDVILRWIKFKKKGNRIYIYKDEEKNTESENEEKDK